MEKSEKNVSKFAYRFKESFNSISSNKAGNILAVGGRGSTARHIFFKDSPKNSRH